MLQALENVLREVSEQKTVNASVVALLDGLGQKVSQLQQELTNLGVSSATLDAIAADLDAGQQDLAAAVTRNTPAAGETPAPTPVPPPAS